MWENKNISVIGLGITGISLVKLLKKLKANIFVSEINPQNEFIKQLDNLNIKYELGKHTEKIIENCDLIIKSPGVSHNLEILKIASKKNISILSELEFSYGLIKPGRIIAITGTNGKTTTTTLTGEILKKSGYKVVVAGNIKEPLSEYVDKIDKNTYVVLEVSSYQLEDTYTFKPDISCILNISPDHLEHHKTMQEYIKIKFKIFENQTEENFFIYNYNSKYLVNSLRSVVVKPVKISFSVNTLLNEGTYIKNGKLTMDFNRYNFAISPKIKIPGNHNLENILASITISGLCNVSPEIIEKTIQEFKGVEHRLEFVDKINGVTYINDSKSTNIDSTFVALSSFNSPIILIMGGRDKGYPYTGLKKIIKEKVKLLLVIGEATQKIVSQLFGSTKIIECDNIEYAVKQTKKFAVKGDIVLLSPGCSSFDQFKNFEHRGNVFKELVKKLK